jgi:cytochrome c oxidase assembly factor CtaG
MHAGVGVAEWLTEPALVPVIAAGLAYARGVTRTRVRRETIAYFAAGWMVIALALLSPLHALSEQLFSAHMVQHELLMVVAAPLVILGRPSAVMIWAIPRAARRAIAPVLRVRVHAREAWIAHAAVIWLWHVPVLFEATLHSEVMHALQHISFFGSALLFWSSVLRPRRRAALGLSIVSVFTTAVHMSVLGALMTFARVPWYPAYVGARGLTPAEDQQLAGLIMWIPASVAYLVAALLIARRWLASSEVAVTRANDASAIA